MPDRPRVVLTTERLSLRELDQDDAPFILELLNDPAWLRFIGDKGVRTTGDARRYLTDGPLDSYRRFGHGLWLVLTRDGGTPVGICGLIRRPTLDDVDVGFAIAEVHRGKRYATEATRGSLEHGRNTLGMTRIVAITSPENHGSAAVLDHSGLRFERVVTLDADREPLHLFAWEAGQASIRLREVRADDVEVFHLHQQDRESRRRAAFTAAAADDPAAHAARWERLLATESVVARTILCDDRVAGHVARFERDGVPEVTYWIGREFEGAGIATAALGAFLHRLHHQHRGPGRPLVARAAAENVASIRVLEKCGFAVTGRGRAFAEARGEEIDEIVLTLI